MPRTLWCSYGRVLFIMSEENPVLNGFRLEVRSENGLARRGGIVVSCRLSGCCGVLKARMMLWGALLGR